MLEYYDMSSTQANTLVCCMSDY